MYEEARPVTLGGASLFGVRGRNRYDWQMYDIGSRRAKVRGFGGRDCAAEVQPMFNWLKKRFRGQDSFQGFHLSLPPTEADSAAALVLAKKGDATVLPTLIQGLLKSDYKTHPSDLDFVRGLRGLGAAAVPPLIQALGRERSERRSAIVDVLGDIGDSTAVPALVDALNDSNKFVRTRAAQALRKIKDPESVPALVQRLLNVREDWTVHSEIAKALGEIGSVDAIPGLATFLAASSSIDSWGSRENAVKALQQIKDERCVAPLRLALRDSVHHVREAAAAALEVLGQEPPETPLRIQQIEQLTEQQLSSLLREVARATMGGAPPHLDSYAARRETAREIGRELYRRGGVSLMKRVLDEGPIPGQRTIDQFWDGIGDWRG